MFYYLQGKLAYTDLTTAVIDVGGVGYKLTVSGTTYSALPRTSAEPTVKLYTYMAVREDEVELFGFYTEEELSAFKLLITVSGVGPKAAMSILSSGGPQNFTLAVMTGDEKMLTAAQGIGKKIAQRIILELKDKIGGGSVELDFSGPAVSAPVQQGGSVPMARAALQELGYSPAEISAALKGVDASASTEEMVRHALRAMVMKG